MDESGGVVGAQSLERAFRVVDVVASAPAPVAEIAAATELARPTVARILNALSRRGFVEQRQDRTWQLGPAPLLLAARWHEQVGLPSLCQAELDRLANAFRESAYLCVRDGLQSLCVAGVESSRAVRFSLSIGARTQLHAGAINEVLLAYSPAWVAEALLAKGLPQLTPKTIVSRAALERRLAEIRAQGWWETSSEADEGVTSIAAPVRTADGRFQAALGVSGPSGRLDEQTRAAVRRDVAETAARLTAQTHGQAATSPAAGERT